MNLRQFFRDAERVALDKQGFVNPTKQEPKKMYLEFYKENSIGTFRDQLFGGVADNTGHPVLFIKGNPSVVGGAAFQELNPFVWQLSAWQENLKPRADWRSLVLLMAVLNNELQRDNLPEKGREVLREWANFIRFSDHAGQNGRLNRLTVTQFLGFCQMLDEKIDAYLAEWSSGNEEVLALFEDDDAKFSANSIFTQDVREIFSHEEILSRLDGVESTGGQSAAGNEDNFLSGTVRLAAALTQNLLLLGPPGTGKTYLVQNSIQHIPVVQVSLEGSTEPETVIANIAQTPEGKFQPFLAETAKALKLGMLLAIVERVRQGADWSVKAEAEKTVDFEKFLGKLPKNSKLAEYFPKAEKASSEISEELEIILGEIKKAFKKAEAAELRFWFGTLDAFADPFDLARWDEILFVYRQLEAHAVGTTCVLNIEEIYHAVENRKILDLLINLMAGQKKLPLSKAGVVGGELYGFNVAVFATGNPIHETYLPPALESRFGFKEFLGYPADVEEKRRMAATLAEYREPPRLAVNLASTRLADFIDAVPLEKVKVSAISENLREKIYNLVNWTRSMFDNQELRQAACPRMSKMWELLTAAFLAEGKTEREAFLLAVKATALGLVSIDFKGEPDPEDMKNLFQQAESYFLN